MLQGKTIVVTGASRGIGEAIARACVDSGANVVLASRKQADLDRVCGSLPADRAGFVAGLGPLLDVEVRPGEQGVTLSPMHRAAP